jgi:quinol monooxygenase YgiN
MPEPIVFVSHSRVKEGKLEGLREFMRESTPRLRADKPRTLTFLAYLNESRSELTVVHVFADAAAMDVHMEGVSERVAKAYEYIETIGVDIYGRPSDSVLDTMRSVSTPGFTLNLQTEHLGGFLRADS